MKRERAQELMKLTPEMHELLKQAFKAMDSSAQRGHRISGQHACPTCMLQHDSSTRLSVCFGSGVQMGTARSTSRSSCSGQNR